MSDDTRLFLRAIRDAFALVGCWLVSLALCSLWPALAGEVLGQVILRELRHGGDAWPWTLAALTGFAGLAGGFCLGRIKLTWPLADPAEVEKYTKSERKIA